jgi:acyl-CoA thioester hydrolase
MPTAPHETAVEFRVRYSEVDRMNVAYHAHYLQWAELGRTEHLRRHGFRYRDLEERGCRLAVAEAALRWMRPARYDDLLRVTAWVTAVGSRKVAFAYRIERDGELLATAETTLVSLAADGRAGRLPDDVRSMLSVLLPPSGAKGPSA